MGNRFKRFGLSERRVIGGAPWTNKRSPLSPVDRSPGSTSTNRVKNRGGWFIRLKLREIEEVLDAMNPVVHKLFNLLVLAGCIVVLGLIIGEKLHLLHAATAATEFDLIKAQ